MGGANLVSCELLGWADGKARIRLGSVELEIDSPRRPESPIVVLRPSAVELEQSDSATSLAGTIRKATYLGSHWELSIDTEVGELLVTYSKGWRPVSGDSIFLRLHPCRLALVTNHTDRDGGSSLR